MRFEGDQVDVSFKFLGDILFYFALEPDTHAKGPVYVLQEGVTMDTPQLKPVHDVPDIDLDDIDKLLESLSPEELEELNGDFDPDVSLWSM